MLTVDDDGPTGEFELVEDDRGPLVLLAEDDDEMRNLISRKLKRSGYDVIEVKNGAELAELVEDGGVHSLRPDGRGVELIVSDIRMPGVTGLEVVALVRGTDWSIPVILITAFGDHETHVEAMRLGAVLLDKPLDLDELVFAARRLVVE